MLTAFIDAHPGSNRLDQALLLIGLCHQQTGENLLAVEEFNRLIRDFPQSALREQAEFERAHSYFRESLGAALDPENTELAIELARSYVQRYPQGSRQGQALAIIDASLEKLATKAYWNAETYLRMGRDRAATIYLEKALSLKEDFRHKGEALARLARARTRLGETEKAQQAWEQLLGYATVERSRTDRRLAELRREAEEALRCLDVSRSERVNP